MKQMKRGKNVGKRDRWYWVSEEWFIAILTYYDILKTASKTVAKWTTSVQLGTELIWLDFEETAKPRKADFEISTLGGIFSPVCGMHGHYFNETHHSYSLTGPHYIV